MLNVLALVCCFFHNVIAPQASGCMPWLARCVHLKQEDMLTVAGVVQPWWRCVKAGRDVTDTGIASFVAACPYITSLDISFCHKVTDTGLASVAAVCTVITKKFVYDMAILR